MTSQIYIHSSTKGYSYSNVFFEEVSVQENFLKFLFESGATFSNGKLKNETESFPIPKLPSSINQTARSLFNEVLELSTNNLKASFSIGQLLSNENETNPEIEFAGGFTRQQLASNVKYLAKIIAKITKREKTSVMAYLTPELLVESKRKLPDHDIRVICPNSSIQGSP